mmetsp:Transcript_27543/g.91396  ORF Transcript_27543/g.91396 Transcript_27543/m.91396 type:complete len:433 (+) Transcript_27543:134-1432(+)
MPATGADEWHWVNLPGGNVEQPLVDLCECTEQDAWHSGLAPEGCGPGRGCIVVQTNATSSFHVIFSHTAAPSRNTQEPVLRFVVGKRRNSMTSVGLGNPYLKKEPIETTKSADALLTSDPEKSRTFWFLYDKSIGVAAMGCQGAPQADLCRLVCRFRDTIGFRAEVCEGLRYISLSSGKRPVSLRIIGAGAPPDVSIPRFRFDPVAWQQLPWQGASVVFQPPTHHRQLLERAQQILANSPIAPFYCLVEPRCLCLNVYRLLDPHRRGELLEPGEDGESVSWDACYEEVHRRLEPLVLRSAPWTYWPLRFDRADATTVTLAPTGLGCKASMDEWSRQVQASSGLRNSATNREVLTIAFAFEVFPVEGENAAQVRRDVVREITALLEKEWGTSEFRSPELAVWQAHTDFVPYTGGGLDGGDLTTKHSAAASPTF